MPRDDDDPRDEAPRRDEDDREPRRRRRRDDDYDDRRDRRPPEGGSGGKVVLIVVAVVGLFACLGVGGCVALIGYAARQAERKQEEERRQAEESKKNPIVISPAELVKEYRSNEVAADNRFKNKWIRIEGEVKRVSKHPWDETKMNVELGSGERFDFLEVTCQFDENAANQVAKLKTGDTVTILGRCKGKSFHVELVDCEFVK